jgi:rhodanese-related sulfurtransferase
MAYAGDLRPAEAWAMLEEEPAAQLIDVRTRPEWAFVGVPDLGRLGKRAAFVSWQVYPTMQANPTFADEVRRVAPSTEAPLLFICRSGARSRSAAEAMTALGFRRCYNVAEGFEGHSDSDRHRGGQDGWKAAGLPWVQD